MAEMKVGRKVSLVACVAEFVGMALFVLIGCGSAMGIQGSGSEAAAEMRRPLRERRPKDVTLAETI